MLIVRLDAIGDALTMVPAVAALRRHGYRIGAVLRAGNAGAFASRALDRVHVAGTPHLAEQLRAERYGAALIASEKPEAYRIARDAAIPVRIGFENGWGKPLKTLWVRRICTQTVFRTAGLDPGAPHECEVAFKLAQRLIPDAQPPRDAEQLRNLVVDEVPAPDARIAMQISDKWERLGASEDDVADLYRRVASRHGVRLIGAQAERAYAERFSRSTGGQVELFGDTAEWKSAIAAARALVAPDSGAAHVAGMTGTPVVACFAAPGFTLQSARWSPWAAPYRTVQIGGTAWPLVAADALEELITGSPSGVYTG